jgi:hypothetical protein
MHNLGVFVQSSIFLEHAASEVARLRAIAYSIANFPTYKTTQCAILADNATKIADELEHAHTVFSALSIQALDSIAKKGEPK